MTVHSQRSGVTHSLVGYRGRRYRAACGVTLAETSDVGSYEFVTCRRCATARGAAL